MASDPLTWELEQFVSCQLQSQHMCDINLSSQWVIEQGPGNYVYIRSEGKKYWSIASSPENGVGIIVGNNKQNWEIRQDPQDPKAFR